MNFINLTPHAIVLNDGAVYQPSGTIARVSAQFSEEERKLGELDLTEEEYDQLKADKDFFSKRGTFVICYNGKNFNGLAIAGQPGFNSKFNWEQLRSEWHPKEISGILREDWDYLKNRDYSLFEDLLEASLSELM